MKRRVTTRYRLMSPISRSPEWSPGRRRGASSRAVLWAFLCAGILPAWGIARGADVDRQRQRFEKFTPAQKLRVIDNFNDFQTLSDEEQSRLRTLQASLAKASDKTALEETMEAFARWVDTLTPTQRAKLDSATSNDQRIEYARSLVKEQNELLSREIRDSNPEPDRRPGRGFRPDPGMIDTLAADLSAALDQAAKKKPFKPGETQALKDWNPKPVPVKLPLLLALMREHKVEFSVPTIGTRSFPVESFLRRPLDAVIPSRFAPMPEVETDNPFKLHRVILLMYQLPMRDEQELVKYLNDLGKKNQTSHYMYRQLLGRFRDLPLLAANGRWYLDNWDKVPKTLQGEFADVREWYVERSASPAAPPNAPRGPEGKKDGPRRPER